MKILHLTAHLGGGVGKALSGLIARASESDSGVQHLIVCLEGPEKSQFIDRILRYGSHVIVCPTKDRLEKLIGDSDIIQLEFWNHPLLFKFLLNYKLPDCRLIIYAHVSWIYAPNIIPQGMFDFADTIILSTPASMDHYIDHIQRGRCRVIQGIGGVTRTSGLQKVQHAGINIAYIGTASYSKLHPGFIQACRMLLKRVPEVRFIVASNDDNSHLRAETEDLSISNHFEFYYRTDNIEKILGRSDLFGYPLRPDHFGTGEQALLEAMGAGVAPVVIGNPAEKSLIKDGETGIIAHDIYDYVGALQYCIAHPDFANRIGAQAKTFALKNFAVEKTVSLFDHLYQQAIIKPKTARNFKDFFTIDNLNPGWSLFKLCLGNYTDMFDYENADNEMLQQYFRDKIMRSSQLMSENKGGMRMYHKYFPEDPQLSRFLMQAIDPSNDKGNSANEP